MFFLKIFANGFFINSFYPRLYSTFTRIKIIFNQNNETYTIYNDGNIFTDFPGSNNGIVNLSDNDNSGVDITNVNLNGSNVLTFTEWGNCLQSGTITLNYSREIHINDLTGYWEVINS